MSAEFTNPEYGNWVPAKFILGPLALAAVLLALTLISPLYLIGALPCLLLGSYFAYAHRAFSPQGGAVQARLWEMVVDRLDWSGEGRALDIGCGNGPLTIALARLHPDARVVGMDCWEGAWDYARAACERNAEAAGVAQRVELRNGSASALPFPDDAFDAVVSNNVFHEVADTRDKRELVREALRVVKKGGRFAFQDLFLWRVLYGEIDDLLEVIRGWGVAEVEFVDTSCCGFIPAALKLPFMVGKIGIIYGTK